MMKSALPYLRKQRGGHIVNVTGLTGHMGTPALSARCASDHALEGFTDVCLLLFSIRFRYASEWDAYFSGNRH